MLENPEPVALGVYGIGKHACRTILPAIAVSERVRLVGIASRDIEVLRAQSNFWECRAWPSLNDMLREPEVDAVMVSPVFSTSTRVQRQALGVMGLRRMTASATMPVFALGGLNTTVLPRLRLCGAAGFAGVGEFLRQH